MLNYAAFWTDISNFDKVREMLKSEFGLKGPRDDPSRRTEREILVFESDKPTKVLGETKFNGKLSNGIFRVHFNYENDDGSNIVFNYWNKIIPKSKDEDTMAAALLRTYEILKPVKVTSYDITLQVIKNLEDSVNSPELIKIPLNLK